MCSLAQGLVARDDQACNHLSTRQIMKRIVIVLVSAVLLSAVLWGACQVVGPSPGPAAPTPATASAYKATYCGNPGVWWYVDKSITDAFPSGNLVMVRDASDVWRCATVDRTTFFSVPITTIDPVMDAGTTSCQTCTDN